MTMRSSDDTAAAETLQRRAIDIRRLVVQMCAARGQGYAGQGLELADLMAVLYHYELREPLASPPGDHFVLSVGHSAIALYAALGSRDVFSLDELRTYGGDGTHFEESPLEGMTGFTVTGGSLGQGLSQALGLALGERLLGSDRRVYCVFSDGELQEGNTMEAILAAPNFGADNLVGLVDNNGEQADGNTAEIMPVEPVDRRLAAFGWAVQRVDGHDIRALLAAFNDARTVRRRPQAIVCDTTPGHGVPVLASFGRVHYVKAHEPVWEQALAELDEARARLDAPA